MSKTKTTLNERHHLVRCLGSIIFSKIFFLVIEAQKPLRQRDLSEKIKDKSTNLVGNYLRRLVKYKVFQKHKIVGEGTFYAFADSELQKFAATHFEFLGQ